MQKIKIYSLLVAAVLLGWVNSDAAPVQFDDGHVEWNGYDLTADIAEIDDIEIVNNYERIENVAQYKKSDWSQVIGIKHGISIVEAKAIADSHSEISYFFWIKGNSMVLETADGNYRVFKHGDAVFFTGTPWWGSATDLADGYVKS